MASVSLRNVSKSYDGKTPVVRDVSLDVPDGQILTVLGPSGCGKSTLLRLIAGLETADTGEILIGGESVNDRDPKDRDVAMVFQSYALYPHKSVRENLAFGLRMRHLDAARVAARVDATAAALGIGALLDRKPAQLSGGQRQRVALGRAIVREPRAFLFDEPLSNLDPILRASTRAELAVLHRRLRSTMVYVTHDQEEAMTLGTRIAVMREGAIEQVAPALEVYQQPANTFVARFVGSPAMNVWTCACRRVDGRVRLVSPALSIDLEQRSAAVPDGIEVTVGARPHDVDLVPHGQGDGTGRVEVVEPVGSTTVVHLRVDGSPDELLRTIVPADTPIAVDQEAGFRLRRNRLHLFDARSGQRLAADSAQR